MVDPADMEREGAGPSLHDSIAGALARAASAQDTSRMLVEAHAALQERVTATLARIAARRESDADPEPPPD